MGLLYANDLGNREKGIEFLEKAVLANPHSRNLSELVNQYASGPDWKRGVTFLESLPESPLTQSTLGDLYLRVGHYKESIEHLEKAKTPGEAPDPRLGQAYFLSGNLNKAIQVDTERKEKSAGNEERKKLAGIDLADKYVRVGEVDKAIKEVEDVLALDPHNQEAVTRLEEFRRLRTKSSAE
jgi:tetratricopeptide (TPR) repeat protein